MIRRVNYETTRTGLTDREKREPLLPCHSHRQGITCMRITSVVPFILHAPIARVAIPDSTYTITHWGFVGARFTNDNGREGARSTGPHPPLPPYRVHHAVRAFRSPPLHLGVASNGGTR